MKMRSTQTERLAMTLTEFRTDVFPCSRAAAQVITSNGELETFLFNGRRMVTPEKAREFVARRAAAGGAIPPEVSEQKRAAGLKGRALQLAQAAQERRTAEVS
jgi:hypothetical protein